MPTITIDVTAAQAARIATAFEARYTLNEGETTNQMVRRKLVEFLKDTVREYEVNLAKQQAAASVHDLDVAK